MYIDQRVLYFLLIIVVVMNLFTGGFDLLGILLTLPGVLLAITFHEYAHAFAAYKLGDGTAKAQGRLTLNPFKHMDIIGFLMLIFAHIGWGRPVEINPNNFDRRMPIRKAEAIVAVAGPVTNFILAFLLTIILYVYQIFAGSFLMTQLGMVILYILLYAIMVNVGLGVFNLIPLPPLDGSKVLMAFLPYNAVRWFEEHTQLFYLIFLLIWITPISSMIVNPVIDGIMNGMDFLVGSIFGLFM